MACVGGHRRAALYRSQSQVGGGVLEFINVWLFTGYSNRRVGVYRWESRSDPLQVPVTGWWACVGRHHKTALYKLQSQAGGRLLEAIKKWSLAVYRHRLVAYAGGLRRTATYRLVTC